MFINKNAQVYHAKMAALHEPLLAETDPEFIELFEAFAFDEVVNQHDLDNKTRFFAILASLLGCQGIDEFKLALTASYSLGVTPVEVKEIVYQAAAYLGIGRTFSFIQAVNDFCKDNGIALPLEQTGTTDPTNRIEKGNQAQVDIFGDHMKGFQNSGPEESRHINKWLAGNCFGDYYTRKGLDYNQREMITFCFLSAQGGCEPQLISHIEANMRIGNDKKFLIKIISQCLPFIGYPRTLNALRCINEVAAKKEEK